MKMKIFPTCYLMAAYPGCRQADMARLKTFARRRLHFTPRQVQIFTPTPSTLATMMYYLNTDIDGQTPLFVEKKLGPKKQQKTILTQEQKTVRKSKKKP